MKYSRLTKEQFEELHVEFANFLASQQIDKEEWETLKNQKPEVAEQELDIFSDLVWEGVLQTTKYIEHFSKKHIFLFQCDDKNIDTIVLKALSEEVDFLDQSGLQWLSEHIFTDEVEIKRGNKVFGPERNSELFEIVQQGGILSQGELYNQINDILNQ